MDPQGQQQEYSKPQANQHKYIAVLIIILCLASLGSAIYFLVLHNKKEPIKGNVSQLNLVPSATQTPASDSSPEPIEDSRKITNNWQVYNSTKSAFLIKYPKDWTAKDTEQSDPKILEYVVFNPLSATKAGELSITLTYTTRSYKEVLGSDPQPGETITVASVAATRKLKQDSQRNIVITVAVPFGGVANTLILYGKETYKDIFNQMLSTLTLSP